MPRVQSHWLFVKLGWVNPSLPPVCPVLLSPLVVLFCSPRDSPKSRSRNPVCGTGLHHGRPDCIPASPLSLSLGSAKGSPWFFGYDPISWRTMGQPKLETEAEQLVMRVHHRGGAATPTLVYLPGLHGDWTLVGRFRRALGGRVSFVEITYPRTLTWSLEDYAEAVETEL